MCFFINFGRSDIQPQMRYTIMATFNNSYEIKKLQSHTVPLRHSCLLAFFLLIILDVHGQGLKFYSFDRLIADRTSYAVFGKNSMLFEDSFEINFELAIHDPLTFGFVFHIKNNADNSYYNFSYASHASEISSLMLNAEFQENLIRAHIPQNEFGLGIWHEISLRFDIPNSLIKLKINNEEFFENKSF